MDTLSALRTLHVCPAPSPALHRALGVFCCIATLRSSSRGSPLPDSQGHHFCPTPRNYPHSSLELNHTPRVLVT